MVINGCLFCPLLFMLLIYFYSLFAHQIKQIRAAEHDGMQRNTAVGPSVVEHSNRAKHGVTSECSGRSD